MRYNIEGPASDLASPCTAAIYEYWRGHEKKNRPDHMSALGIRILPSNFAASTINRCVYWARSLLCLRIVEPVEKCEPERTPGPDYATSMTAHSATEKNPLDQADNKADASANLNSPARGPLLSPSPDAPFPPAYSVQPDASSTLLDQRRRPAVTFGAHLKTLSRETIRRKLLREREISKE